MGHGSLKKKSKILQGIEDQEDYLHTVPLGSKPTSRIIQQGFAEFIK